ncbi:MAG: DUF2214 family protein [Giesbergeria sp.]
MILESFLAFFHLVAIFTMVVFMASEAALCRAEWMNAAVVHRLVRLDLIYGIFALCVLLAGLARTFWGVKGVGWYWSQPLLHLKLGLFIVIVLMSLRSTISFLRWRRNLVATGELPPADEVRAIRRWIMIETHLIGLVLLAAALLARGVLTR